MIQQQKENFVRNCSVICVESNFGVYVKKIKKETRVLYWWVSIIRCGLRFRINYIYVT